MRIIIIILLATVSFKSFSQEEYVGCLPSNIATYNGQFLYAQEKCGESDYSDEYGSCASTFIGMEGGPAGPTNPDSPIGDDGQVIPGERSVYTCRTNCTYHYMGASTTYTSYQLTVFIPHCFEGYKKLSLNPTVNSCPLVSRGSVIQNSNQVLGESIPLTGLSFDLNYFSDRVIGRKYNYSTIVPITGSQVVEGITGYNVKGYRANGSLFQDVDYDAELNQNHFVTWDGEEDGVETWGSTNLKFSITQKFSNSSIKYDTGNINVGSLKVKKIGLGGWFPSIWYFYDSNSNTMYSGDGTTRKVVAVDDEGFKRVANQDGTEVYYFDSTGKIIQTKTGLTGSLRYAFAYDSAGRIISITEPFNNITTFSRYLNGNLKAIIASNSVKTSITINSKGYLSKVAGLNSENYEMNYTDQGLLLSFKKPNGLISSMTYDTLGKLSKDEHVSGYRTDLTSSPSGVISTSSMGRSSVYKFDAKTFIETLVDPTGQGHEYYNGPTSSSYHSNVKNSSIVYGNDPRFGEQVKIPIAQHSLNFGARNLTFINTVDLSASTTNPFSFNELTRITKNGEFEVKTIYNAETRTKLRTTALGRTSSLQIDEYERPIHSQIGNMVVRDYIYNNDLLTLMTEGTRKFVLSYYPNKLLKSVRNTLGQVTTFAYDESLRLSSKTLPDSRVVNFTYDFAGNMTSITTPSNRLHQFTFGNNEKLSSYSPPPFNNGNTNTPTSYTYNSDRQLKLVLRPDGKSIAFNYNASTALLESISGDFGTINYDYTYGQAKDISYNGIQMSIDYLGDIISGVTLDVPQDDFTLSTYTRTPDEVTGGRVGSETINGGAENSIPQTVNYSYDADEKLTGAGEMELNYNSPNGQLENTKIGSVRDYYYYNSFGEIRSYKAKFQGEEIYSYELERDSIGRIIKKTETINEVTTIFDYVFDSAGRLIQVSANGVINSTYTYDLNSNRIGGIVHGENTSASYNSQDRLLTYNNYSYGHNLNGDRTYKGLTNNPTPETSFFTNYDSLGNLLKVENNGNTIEYDFDPSMRRLGRNYNEIEKQGYIYNPEGKLIGEMSADLALVKTFVYASKSHVPDYYIDGSSNKFRIITDHLGSVRLLIAVNSGRVLKMMEHDEFGRVLQDTRPGFLPFGFAGGIYDKDTKLIRFGVRDYDPETGRWLSKDPIRFEGGDTNLYGYVMNDPVNFIDPEGQSAEDVFYSLPIDWQVGLVRPRPINLEPRDPSQQQFDLTDLSNKCSVPPPTKGITPGEAPKRPPRRSKGAI